jgi:hypothetical protein
VGLHNSKMDNNHTVPQMLYVASIISFRAVTLTSHCKLPIHRSSPFRIFTRIFRYICIYIYIYICIYILFVWRRIVPDPACNMRMMEQVGSFDFAVDLHFWGTQIQNSAPLPSAAYLSRVYRLRMNAGYQTTVSSHCLISFQILIKSDHPINVIFPFLLASRNVSSRNEGSVAVTYVYKVEG